MKETDNSFATHVLRIISKHNESRNGKLNSPVLVQKTVQTIFSQKQEFDAKTITTDNTDTDISYRLKHLNRTKVNAPLLNMTSRCILLLFVPSLLWFPLGKTALIQPSNTLAAS